MAIVGFPPAWLHNEFLEKILTTSPSDSKLVVTRSEQDRPEEAVDGTLTVLFRVVVHMERSNGPRDRSLIVKTVVQSLEFFRKCKIFEREARMYTYMLPAVHKVLLEFSSDLIPSFSPKCIYTELENPAPCIIMEDITVEGFKTMSKDDAQNINICKNVARAMAKYHVGTIGPCERAPQMLEVLAEDVYNAELRAKLEPLYRGVLKCVAREVESWPVYGDKFAGGLRRLADNVMDIIANSARASVEGMQVLSCSDLLEERREKQNCYELKVLTHGDLIMSNIMLKSSNGSPDVRFLDYQFSSYASPAIDLIRFIYTLPNEEILKSPRVVLEEYFKCANETIFLLQLPYKFFFDYIVDEIEKRSDYCVIMTATLLPIHFGDKETHKSVFELLRNIDDPSYEPNIHLTEEYKRIFKQLLDLFDEKMWL
ncbi:uncharacterized protein [Periplaneta americana]|uniref:uncharacterized protein n=1 Tax=Periplaneta americana TaxID=6978 RepID=UPI0037E81E72